MDDFWQQVAKFIFFMLAVYGMPFSQLPLAQTDTEKQTKRWKHTNPVWLVCAWPIFWPLSTFVCVSTHTLGTTGLDQLNYNRCVKLQRQLFLNFTAEPWW